MMSPNPFLVCVNLRFIVEATRMRCYFRDCLVAIATSEDDPVRGPVITLESLVVFNGFTRLTRYGAKRDADEWPLPSRFPYAVNERRGENCFGNTEYVHSDSWLLQSELSWSRVQDYICTRYDVDNLDRFVDVTMGYGEYLYGEPAERWELAQQIPTVPETPPTPEKPGAVGRSLRRNHVKKPPYKKSESERG